MNYEPVFLPMMTEPQPDTAERVRLAVQSIPFALPEKKRELVEVGPDRMEGTSPWR